METYNRIKAFIIRNFKSLIAVLILFSALITGISDIDKVVNYFQKINPFSSLNKELSINIDMNLTDVNLILGKPNETNGMLISYFSHGIQIAPDYEFRNNVGGIVVKQLPSGVMYKGIINGIKLNYTFEEIKEELGEPTYWGISSELSSTAIWTKENSNILTIVDFSKEKQWKANKITYSKQSSIVTYLAILTSAIQELKANRVSVFFEELNKKGNSKLMDADVPLKEFIAKFLHKDYDIIGIKGNPFGGVHIILGYEDAILVFWVYPLEWEQPSIRAIINANKYYADELHNKTE